MNLSNLVDRLGRPIRSGERAKIIDLSGRAVTSAPETGASTPAAGTAAPTPRGKVEIKGFLVACACSDGHFRQVILKDKETKKLTKLLQRMHKGKINLQAEPVFFVVRQRKEKVVIGDQLSVNQPSGEETSHSDVATGGDNGAG